VLMRGKESAVRGEVGDLYKTGTQTNIAEFYQAVTQGDCSNPTVVPSVRSNLTAVLGREAAYRRTELTLKSLIKQGKKLEPDLKGLKA
jgi:myo-inositol 2-dehydrogenase / D-chiro-inositol 1-dehydrogenase